MIKVGDKVTFDGDDYVIHNMEESGVTLYKDGNPLRPNFMGNVVFYSELAREQKQRADELEKRWSELGKIISSKYNVIDDASFKTILLFVILLMKDLQEDND